MDLHVKKIFNNNVILGEDERMSEMILLGKGIAFQKKIGDLVDVEKIDRTYVFKSSEDSSKFVSLLQEVPLHHVELSRKVIEQAQVELNVTFHDGIYIGLTDHISYTLSRYRDGIEIRNALLWEIKKYYPKEYRAGENAIKLIEYYEKIKLSEDEVGFIALHFVNAQQDGEEIQKTIIVTEIVNDILSIVKYHYQIELNEDTLNYSRFVTHIRFFARRMLSNELLHSDDDFLYQQVKNKLTQAVACAEKVRNYIMEKLDVSISQEEMLYFIVHINRVASRGDDKKAQIK